MHKLASLVPIASYFHKPDKSTSYVAKSKLASYIMHLM